MCGLELFHMSDVYERLRILQKQRQNESNSGEKISEMRYFW